jgi:hypothetical protein
LQDISSNNFSNAESPDFQEKSKPKNEKYKKKVVFLLKNHLFSSYFEEMGSSRNGVGTHFFKKWVSSRQGHFSPSLSQNRT